MFVQTKQINNYEKYTKSNCVPVHFDIKYHRGNNRQTFSFKVHER